MNQGRLNTEFTLGKNFIWHNPGDFFADVIFMQTNSRLVH